MTRTGDETMGLDNFHVEWGVYLIRQSMRFPQWRDAYNHDAYMQAMHVMALETID